MASTVLVKDYDEALQNRQQRRVAGLREDFATTSLKYARHFQRNVRAGTGRRSILPTAGVDYHVPFGGTRRSSYGAPSRGSPQLNSTHR